MRKLAYLSLSKIYDKVYSLRVIKLPLVRGILKRLSYPFWRYLLCPLKNTIVEVHGYKMETGPRPFDLIRFLYGAHDKEVVCLFKQVIREGMTVVDIGAHVGYFALLAAKQAGPTGKVYAFEPEFENYALLTKNIKLNDYTNIVAIQKAVSDKTEAVKLFLSKDSGEKSLYPSSYTDERFEIVEATTLDDFFEKEGRPLIHLIKIDVEGGELPVLKGMSKVVKNSNFLKIILEFFPSKLRAAGTNPEELLDKLKEFGLKIWLIKENGDLGPFEFTKFPDRRYPIVNLLCEKSETK